MATVIQSIGLKGLEGYKVHVEVQIIPGKESVCIVGLPDACVKESKERVIGALYANQCELPDRKVIINLSPAEQRKNSPIFDLAMAIGIMKEMNHFRESVPSNAAFLGSLSLDGTIKPVEGMLPAIMAAKQAKVTELYLPFVPEMNLSQIEGITLHYVHSLDEVLQSFAGQTSFQLQPQHESTNLTPPSPPIYEKDFKDIIGHQQAKRALEIAAAGGHNVLLSGPPGCGKSLLANTFPSILPPLTIDSTFEVMSIYQLAGITIPSGHLPPYRAPHHSSSSVSLIGGGTNPKPGEVTLAHRGVLFLDEMAEFPKKTLDMLRQPIESGKVTISRAASTVTYPSKFILIGAMNPCPCGYLGDRHHYCTCSPKQVNAYQNRISGPILDRMDILLTLSPVSFENETTDDRETSKIIRDRVIQARDIQYERYQSEINNAGATYDQLLNGEGLRSNQQKMLQQWSSKHHLSNRVEIKIISLARTISDLQGNEHITDEALWEAMTLRRTTNVQVQQKVMVR